ncbi:amphi-Trp domain-containing protein [Micromonospora sp. NPDC000207]|uniref:amphi-Trp domain-containing protein n=1 Tax=Micromonospora sp. NPDC000207 TaxID=3154246 RepID=UPI00331EB8A1
MDIYEDERTVSRADLAAWLRQLASQLEETGKIFYGAGGAVVVADEVECELEIEEDGDELSVEIEFSWTKAKPAEATTEPTAETDSDDKADAGSDTTE